MSYSINPAIQDKPERRAAARPEKPSKNFPMYAHASGMWAKKIRKRLYYFGSWRQDPTGEAALEQFEREWPYLRKGETPPPIDVGEGCRLHHLVNDFLATKEEKMRANDLSPRTFMGYYHACEALVGHFGRERRVDDLRPDNFRAYRAKLAKQYGVVGLGSQINLVSIVMNYAYENALVSKPIDTGQNFERPSAKAIRRDRNEAGPKLFERDEVLRILAALEGKAGANGKKAWYADPALRAMTLLAINGGLGNSDMGNLREKHLDLDAGWLTMARVKTEIPRRIPLWPETRAALKEALAARPEPKAPADNGLVFLTRLGQPWVRVRAKKKDDKEIYVPTDAISGQFGKLLGRLEINGRRGLNFYALRHCFETYAGECRDQVAVDAIMGHVDTSMAANYRHRISDERLLAVVETVRAWLFPATRAEGGDA